MRGPRAWVASRYNSKFGPEWRNWQTRGTQNPVLSRECGFDPLLRHILFLLFDSLPNERAVRQVGSKLRGINA